MRNLLSSFVVIMVFWCIAPGALEAGRFHVANNGVDGPTCGSMVNPCRSISNAISNAVDGDRILVGPGLYGDLNGDGDFLDPGDEAAEFNFGCFCLVKVEKRLAFESLDGAAATLLEVDGEDFRGVFIKADGVQFGRRRKGFTIANARRAAVFVDGDTNGVKIVGNTAIGNGLNGNNAFIIDGSSHTIAENIATGNARSGFGIVGTGHTITNNVASGNAVDGFELIQLVGGQVSGNVAIGNTNNGMSLDGNILEDVKFTRNTIVGNQGGGVGIREFSATVTFTMNNIFGNNPATNCG